MSLSAHTEDGEIHKFDAMNCYGNDYCHVTCSTGSIWEWVFLDLEFEPIYCQFQCE